MSVANEVAAHLPYLRRFARAVTGSQKSGDAYVASTLEAIVADPDIFPDDLPARVALYHTFLKILNSVSVNDRPGGKAGGAALDAADRHLDVLTPRARQAFLLVAVEDFPAGDAAAVMDVSPVELQNLIDQAGREIAQEMATTVVIIEDEPLIAMELEQLVSDLGHRVVQVARTRQQAIAAINKHKPGLVLADIQLADGSSGLDAINDVLKTYEVAVVFITAYPHRLLTGTRPEPKAVPGGQRESDHQPGAIFRHEGPSGAGGELTCFQPFNPTDRPRGPPFGGPFAFRLVWWGKKLGPAIGGSRGPRGGPNGSSRGRGKGARSVHQKTTALVVGSKKTLQYLILVCFSLTLDAFGRFKCPKSRPQRRKRRGPAGDISTAGPECGGPNAGRTALASARKRRKARSVPAPADDVLVAAQVAHPRLGRRVG